MTIERRQVKESLLLNKQNKEMQRFDQRILEVYSMFFLLVLLN